MNLNHVLKKIVLGTVLFSCGVLFSNETHQYLSQTRQEIAKQPTQKYDHHVIFTGDILFGKVEFVSGESSDGNPAITEMWGLQDSFPTAAGVETLHDARLIENQAKFGFMAGFGVALNRTFDLVFRWKYLRSGKTVHTLLDWKQPIVSPLTFFQLTLGAQGTPNSFFQISEPSILFDLAVDVSNYFKNRLHVIDLMVQTSHWMTSNLRFFPFGGVRYLYRKTTSNTDAGFTQTTKNDHGTFFSHENYTQSSFAVIFGTDIRYLIWKEFFFFSTILSQLKGDFSRKTRISLDNSLNDTVFDKDQGIFNHTFRDSNLNVRHSWEQKYGFAWEHLFGDDWLLSFRLFVEWQENLFEDYGFGFSVLF